MTVIAWDGKTLAGDKQENWSGVPVRTRKLFRLKGPRDDRYIAGFAGTTEAIMQFCEWFPQQEQKPTIVKDDLWGLLVDGRRHVFAVFAPALILIPLNRKQWAIGSGGDYALGAMSAGASAVEAVRIASRLNTGCGLGVDALRFA